MLKIFQAALILTVTLLILILTVHHDNRIKRGGVINNNYVIAISLIMITFMAIMLVSYDIVELFNY
jgi:hypothetical protein